MHYDIISERKAKYQIQITSPVDAYSALKRYATKKQEHFLVLNLNANHTVIRMKIVSIGLVNRTIVHPREVYRCAIHDLATAIIIAHNHPSGKLEPSMEDLDITHRLKEAGEILGIPVLDHLIFGSTGYVSLQELGQLR